MKNKRFIVKIQFPLFSTDPKMGALIYNEDHSIYYLATPEQAKLMRNVMGNTSKCFWWTEQNADGKLNFNTGDEAPWQDW